MVTSLFYDPNQCLARSLQQLYLEIVPFHRVDFLAVVQEKNDK